MWRTRWGRPKEPAQAMGLLGEMGAGMSAEECRAAIHRMADELREEDSLRFAYELMRAVHGTERVCKASIQQEDEEKQGEGEK